MYQPPSGPEQTGGHRSEGHPLHILQVDIEKGWGGGQRQVIFLCRGLLARGHRVTLACRPDGVIHGRIAGTGTEILPLSVGSEIDPRGIVKMARYLRSVKPDVLHMHSSHSHTMGLMAARLAGYNPRLVSRRVDVPVGRDPINRWKYGRSVTLYLAISQSVRDVLSGCGIDADRIDVVHSGVRSLEQVENARTSVVEEWGLPKDSILIGQVANLLLHKGHRTLLRAAPQLLERNPRIQFILVGDGKMRQSLERLAATLGVADRIVFAGFRSDVPRFFSAFDIAVFPSLTEGLCTSILDALSLGLPVVASRTGGIPEIIRHGETGLLVTPDSPGELGQAIEQLINDPLRAGRLGKTGRDLVGERFSVDQMVDGTVRVYRSLLER